MMTPIITHIQRGSAARKCPDDRGAGCAGEAIAATGAAVAAAGGGGCGVARLVGLRAVDGLRDRGVFAAAGGAGGAVGGAAAATGAAPVEPRVRDDGAMAMLASRKPAWASSSHWICPSSCTVMLKCL